MKDNYIYYNNINKQIELYKEGAMNFHVYAFWHFITKYIFVAEGFEMQHNGNVIKFAEMSTVCVIVRYCSHAHLITWFLLNIDTTNKLNDR